MFTCSLTHAQYNTFAASADKADSSKKRRKAAPSMEQLFIRAFSDLASLAVT
jgi:hypothetical protein